MNTYCCNHVMAEEQKMIRFVTASGEAQYHSIQCLRCRRCEKVLVDRVDLETCKTAFSLCVDAAWFEAEGLLILEPDLAENKYQVRANARLKS